MCGPTSPPTKPSWRRTLVDGPRSGRRILGLDPGSRYTGYGVVDRKGSRCHHVAHGRLVPPKGQPLTERLAFLAQGLEKVLADYRPDAVACEGIFHGINPRSLIVLAQARGALLAVVGRSGLEVFEYSPSQIKAAVVGSGRADKAQVGHMVRLVLGLGNQKVSEDAGDALATAICAAEHRRFEGLVSPSGR